MTFQKPKDVTYTEMAIYIDNNIYTEDFDAYTIYQYIYHLINMLAVKKCFFTKAQYYDDFSIMAASRIYMRLTNPKQFQFDEDGNPKLSRIKSVLNYIKSIMYPMKVAFEQEHYSQVISEEPEDESPVRPSDVSLDSSSFISIEILDYLKDLPRVIKQYLTKIPKVKNSREWLNIYTSCLLTLLNCFTLTRDKIESLENKENITDGYIEKLYSSDDVILFHLNRDKHDYIQVLTRELKNYIYKELRSIIASYDIDLYNIKNTLYESIQCLVDDEEK